MERTRQQQQQQPAWPRRALAVASLLTAHLAGLVAGGQCPPVRLKTAYADCRYVIGREVSCEEPLPTGSTAYFTCKPFYRPAEGDRPGPHQLASTCRDYGLWWPPPPACVPDCGRVKGRGETLIVDGTPVESSVDFPWHVAVYSKNHVLGSFTQICGGSLITPKFFISAAHCFTAKGDTRTIRPASDFVVGLGKLHKDYNITEEYAQLRDVAEIYTNGYGGQRFNYVKDFAVVEMASEVELNAHILPVCVDWANSQLALKEGDVGAVVGWGNLWSRNDVSLLQSVSLPFVPNDKCLQQIPAKLVQYVLLPNDRFCAGIVNASTVAHGDSGGGIAFQNADRVWFLRGVVSVGIPGLRTLTTFTNVSTFVPWMANVLQDEDILVKTLEKHVAVEIPLQYTATPLEEEQRLALFREDLGLNLFHRHWHYAHPSGSDESVRLTDRRGELFCYVHQQLLSRYDIERLSNGLPRTKRFQDFRDPIKEGYYPKLDNIVASRTWPGRAPNTVLNDVNRDGIEIKIDDLDRWRGRIREAIDAEYVISSSGERINLTVAKGIDLIGHMIESTWLSPNRMLYGDFVNTGRIAFSMVHDPENHFMESFAVMGDPGTAPRDPVFYRWHASGAELFQRHKRKLPSYTYEELDFPGVHFTNFEAITLGNHREANELFTFKRTADVELPGGIDFAPKLPMVIRITHLDHRPFLYRLEVENRNANRATAFVRIFIAPQNDENGSRLSFEEQRLLMVEMDRFVIPLSTGTNRFERNSSQSSVTMPMESVLRNMEHSQVSERKHASELDEYFCNCGWPHHLLLPRGALQSKGQPFHLFAMVSDHEKEAVWAPQGAAPLACGGAFSYCGVRGSSGGLPYPDARAMGFPFDRRARPHVSSLRSFLTPNMFAQAVSIRHLNIIEVTKRNVTVLQTASSGNRGAGFIRNNFAGVSMEESLATKSLS